MRALLTTAMLVVLVATTWSPTAYAQACCAAAQSSGPTRLSAGQMATAGIGLNLRRNNGVFTGTDHRSMSKADYEIRQTGFAAISIKDSLQVGITAPLVQNRIRVESMSESGGGFGDLALQSRFQLLDYPPRTRRPDLGIFASVTAPTGRSRTESMANSEGTLQADVTGGESWQVDAGLQAEWAWFHWFVSSEASASWRHSYIDATGENVDPGLGMRIRVGIGRILLSSASTDENLVAAAGISHMRQGSDRRAETPVANSDERLTSADVQLGGHITKNLHAMLSVTTDLRFDQLGKNRYAGTAVGITIRGVLTDY